MTVPKFAVAALGLAALVTGCMGPAPTTKPEEAAACHLDRATLAALDWNQPDPDAWQRAWRACPASPLAGYNAALSLLAAGRTKDARVQLEDVARLHPDHAPTQRLRQGLDRPLTLAAALADERLRAWLRRPSEVPAFTRQPPGKPELPPLPRLVKGEFEKSTVFRGRVEQARRDREAEIRGIESRYRAQVTAYNRAVEVHNAALQAELAERRGLADAVRGRFLGEALAGALGRPRLQEKPEYDADSETFYGHLKSDNGLFDRKVSISVPIDVGPAFKEAAGRLQPEVRFAVRGERLVVTGVEVPYRGRGYAALFTDRDFDPAAAPVVATPDSDLKIADLPTLPVQPADTDGLVAESNAFFAEAVRLEEDPRLAAMRQEEAENRRLLREAARKKAMQEEYERMARRLEEQKRELARLGGEGADDLRGLTPKRQWHFQRAVGDPAHRAAVIIGNRGYHNGVPLVHYALNDAKAVRDFARQALEVPPENLVYRENVTKGDLDAIFESRLPNIVEPGRTDLLVYFSGHGYPAKGDAMLLPVDSQPGTTSAYGYSRRELIDRLARLGARNVTLVLDACFTGDGLDKGGKFALLPPPQPPSVRGNLLLISAGGADQSAWMDEEAGLSLLTRYLLEGLSLAADKDHDRAVTSRELQEYLADRVDRAARRLHNRSQRPEVVGEARELVRYGEETE